MIRLQNIESLALAILLFGFTLQLNAQTCTPFLFLNCPPESADENSFIDGFTAQVNGATSAICGPSPEFSSWDWGDGSPPVASYFPGSHTYSQPGNYTLTVDIGTFSEQCRFSVPSFGEPKSIPTLNDWMLILLAIVLVVFGLGKIRAKVKPRRV